MSKNPISTLQEYGVKSTRFVPIYEFLGDRLVGTNGHEFTIRVKCNNLSADGKGHTKKEAKQNAAMEMLCLLGIAKSADTSINNSATKSEAETIPTQFDLSPKKQLGSNYLILLHEFCAKNRVSGPIFTEVNSWGPSHMMNFTIRCHADDIQEEGSGSTKKEARAEAARKVWLQLSDKVCSTADKSFKEKMLDLSIEVENFKLENSCPDYQDQNEHAIKKYLQLAKLQIVSLVSDELSLNNCHLAFSSGPYNISLRKQIIDLLDVIDVDKEDVSLLATNKTALENVVKLLNSNLERINLVYREVPGIKALHIIGLKLYPKPLIVSTSFAESEELAELRAIFDMIINLTVFLS